MHCSTPGAKVWLHDTSLLDVWQQLLLSQLHTVRLLVQVAAGDTARIPCFIQSMHQARPTCHISSMNPAASMLQGPRLRSMLCVWRLYKLCKLWRCEQLSMQCMPHWPCVHTGQDRQDGVPNPQRHSHMFAKHLVQKTLCKAPCASSITPSRVTCKEVDKTLSPFI